MSSPASDPDRTTPALQRKSRLQFLPGTWSWLIVALSILSVGAALGARLLLVFGSVLLIVALGNAVLVLRHAGRLLGKRHIPWPLYADKPVRIELKVINQGPRPCLGLEIINDEKQMRLVPELAAGGSFTVVDQKSLARGRHMLGAIWGSTTYPFGLFRRTSLHVPPQGLLVLPALGRLHRAGLRRLLSGRATSLRPGRRCVVSQAPQAEVYGLRDYRPGDTPRAIHWRASARRDRLIVREFEEPQGSGLLVLLDPTTNIGDSADLKEKFEAAVSLAATLCQAASRYSGWLGLWIATPIPQFIGGAPDRGRLTRMLEALAMIQPGSRTDLTAVHACLRSFDLRTGSVVLVGAHPDSFFFPAIRGRRATVYLWPGHPELPVFYEPPVPAAPETFVESYSNQDMADEVAKVIRDGARR